MQFVYLAATLHSSDLCASTLHSWKTRSSRVKCCQNSRNESEKGGRGGPPFVCLPSVKVGHTITESNQTISLGRLLPASVLYYFTYNMPICNNSTIQKISVGWMLLLTLADPTTPISSLQVTSPEMLVTETRCQDKTCFFFLVGGGGWNHVKGLKIGILILVFQFSIAC